MAQQCPQYAGTPHYGLVYPSTYYVQGYPTHQGGYVGHPSAITGHRPASLGYQPLGGHPGHHQNPQNHQVTPAHPATPTVGATQACNFPYGHIHHHRTHPSHANTRPSGHFLDSRTPYKHTYPPSPNSVVFPDPPPTFAASPPPFEDRQQPYTGERTQNQQPQPWAQQTTGTWHDSIPAWSERVPALDLNSELPFQATGHHAHVGVPQMQQGTYIDNTNVVVPPQPQGMYDGADGYPFGMVQASPALTCTSSVQQIRVEADNDAKIATGDDDEELAFGTQCINSREHELFTKAQLQTDGLYHCPFEHKGKCRHEPKAKKCDYDKMVDAHIKQWRCSKTPHATDACLVPMSSCAIRFRHEREQHDDAPYWCVVEDCDRSDLNAPTKAFARHYNRNDHLIRKHAWSKEQADAVQLRYIGHDPENDPPAIKAAAARAAAATAKRRRVEEQNAAVDRLERDEVVAKEMQKVRARAARNNERIKKHSRQKVTLQKQKATGTPSRAVPAPQIRVETYETPYGTVLGRALPGRKGRAFTPMPEVAPQAPTEQQQHHEPQAQTAPAIDDDQANRDAADDLDQFFDFDHQPQEEKAASEWIALFHTMQKDLNNNGPLTTHLTRGSQEEVQEALIRLQNGRDVAFLERMEANVRKLADAAKGFATRQAANQGVDPYIFR